jgi:hypothetical protein
MHIERFFVPGLAQASYLEDVKPANLQSVSVNEV